MFDFTTHKNACDQMIFARPQTDAGISLVLFILHTLSFTLLFAVPELLSLVHGYVLYGSTSHTNRIP